MARPPARARQVVIPYTPRPLQAQLHGELKRFSVVICHRRFGKTVFAINNLVKRLFECKHPNPQGAYIAPTYGQAKRIAWEYLKRYTEVIPGVRFWETELRVDISRGKDTIKIYLLGADNPDGLRGLYLDDCIFDEYADMRPRIFAEVVRPALSDRLGCALWIGTPRGFNHLHTIYEQAKQMMLASNPEWFAALYPASITGVLPQSELDAARAIMSEEQYGQEYECSFEAAVQGAYYGRLMSVALEQGRIANFPVDENRPVNTAWDLGMDDATSIWFWQPSLDGRWVDIVAYYEARGQGLPHYVRELQSRGWIYGKHVAPHDIEVRELGSGKSRREIAASLGLRFEVAPRLNVSDGIEAARVLLPRCRFHADETRAGVEALRQYRQQYNERLGRYADTPLHDWTSHAADAFRTLAMTWDRVGRIAPPMPARADVDFDLFA